MTTPILHEVTKVSATQDVDVYIVNVDLTDMNGERYVCDYCSRPDDSFGLNPIIRAWLTDNPDFPIDPYVPPAEPTAEELRAMMPPISPRQLRLALVRNGHSLASVDAAISALPDGQEKEESQIAWEYGTSFERLSPTLQAVAGALQMAPESVDVMWSQALAI
ncbi:hypothetical protein [Rhizobium sp. Root482]|uniref:hypothetical protein n=1 Tax=Rhizobium sp. Root482 TaxID=1736543 RepID=UPI0009E77C7B|nr:hypothetical protein [Rhizobium sp. Root482]